MMDSGDDGGRGSGGGDYSAFWSNTLDEMRQGKKLTGFGKGIEEKEYNYTNLSGSGKFETPHNDGLTTEQDGEDYYFYGTSTRTIYVVGDNESHFWKDLGGTLGGGVEAAIGIAGEPESLGTSTFLVVDGGDRFLSNGHNLLQDISGKSPNRGRIQTNLGAQIGANFGVNGQKWGGVIDDAATMFVTGGPLTDGLEGFDNFNSGDYLETFLHWSSAYDGVNTIKDDTEEW